MRRRLFDPVFSGKRLKSGLRLFAGAAAIFSLAACQQTPTVEDLLFAPTVSATRASIPSTYNTPYDCRSFTGSGWKGIASGRVDRFSGNFLFSNAGCFKTKAECQAYLNIMSGYIIQTRYLRCAPYSA
ncbi:hypothetical protein [Roseibium aggregatum]|uniref:Uncharacterized protein n=1 Tax=Roseibium aggregatum TaxID=187304 RepID=A0A939EG54_9HYPH|nr:hypothetical protein [Roseibium aggregatum]MBN9671155.1 hypothetical protein [Roseibium aggregatum]